MENRKDYYKILELTEQDKKLPKDEFLKKLSKNYKRLAVKYHPDRNPGDKSAEDKFKEINEANQVLSDYDGKKAEYDNPMSNFHFSGNMDMEEILRHFNMSFGDDFGFNPFGFGGPRQQKGQDIEGHVSFTLEDVLNGVDKKVRYTKKKVCNTCHGSGKDSHSREEMCPHCHGIGFIQSGNGFMSIRQSCPYCHGSGKIVLNPCKTCGGSGLIDAPAEYSFRIPKGAKSGMVFQGIGLGNEIPGQGNIPGDLLVVAVESPHPVFTRQGNDLIIKVNVSVIDAILGTTVKIETIDKKKLKVTIPSGTEEGKLLLVSGYGLPEYGTGERGNLICSVHIVMPKKLSDKEIKALEKLRDSGSFRYLTIT